MIIFQVSLGRLAGPHFLLDDGIKPLAMSGTGGLPRTGFVQ